MAGREAACHSKTPKGSCYENLQICRGPKLRNMDNAEFDKIALAERSSQNNFSKKNLSQKKVKLF